MRVLTSFRRPLAARRRSEAALLLPRRTANVRRVRLVATSNWGDANGIAGLSEVRFLSPGTLLPANPTTTRFRKEFSVPGLPNSTYSLSLQYGVDDGAVFYLNGTEIHRANITGAVATTTPADSNVVAPQLSAIQTLPGTAFTAGTNVLSVELHQAATGSADAWFAASLSVHETRQEQGGLALRFNEIASASSGAFFVELRNMASTPLNTSGWSLRVSTGQTIALPAATLPVGGLLVLDAGQLGFTPTDGSRLFLVGPGGGFLGDAREITNRLRGLTADGQWGYPTTATPGCCERRSDQRCDRDQRDLLSRRWAPLRSSGSNFTTAAPQRWISAAGRFSDGIEFTFPAGTTIRRGWFSRRRLGSRRIRRASSRHDCARAVGSAI